jgi:hypothetical protein
VNHFSSKHTLEIASAGKNLPRKDWDFLLKNRHNNRGGFFACVLVNIIASQAQLIYLVI